MDQVSPDLLLLIFKKLSSIEMFSVMRVEKKWLEIIDENKALWRELVLPSRKNGWGFQALDLFDRKSNSTLKRVSMSVAEQVESGPFVETLEKSKDTLRVLEIKRKNPKVREVLEENLWKFPNLMDCRLTRPPTWYYKLSLQLEERDEGQEDNKGSSLRVLWIKDYSGKLLKSHLYLLDNLVSLLLREGSFGSLGIRRILERPSRTLKHLEIGMSPEEGEEPQIPNLNFPNLKFLDLTLYNESLSAFPSWMKIPSLSTLIICSPHVLSSLPSCSKLWVVSLDEFDDLSKLGNQCPELVQLTLNLNGRDTDTSMDLSVLERFENLSSMLSQRKANVEAGVEIEGVRMINLKTLVIPFEHVGLGGETGLKEAGLSKLRELVGKVVDLSEAQSEIIEIEV